jgi:O-antigen ligase
LVLLDAGLLLAVPVVLPLVVLRPEWTVLVIVAVPPSIVSPIPALRLVAILLAALLGFLLEGGIRLGLKTGIYPMVGIILLGLAVQAQTSGAAAAAADGMRKLLIYYTLLMLVAFHAALNGRLRIDTIVDALLLGLVGAALLQPFGVDTSWESVVHGPFSGQFAYLSVMGFGLTCVRLSIGRIVGRERSLLDVFLMLTFLCLTAIGFSRAGWMAGLFVLALVSRWTSRKSFWVVSALLVILALTVPVVGERVLPGGVAGITQPERLARVTTGRSVLWEEMFRRGLEAPLLGQGWGYVWSLSSTDLFGIEGQFTSGENSGIFPHNDFLYLFVELGVLGIGFLVVLWLSLVRRTRLLSRSHSATTRYSVRVLIPVIVTMLFVQLFDNGFAIRSVAERFFIAAGLIYGFYYVAQRKKDSDVDASKVVGGKTTVGGLSG